MYVLNINRKKNHVFELQIANSHYRKCQCTCAQLRVVSGNITIHMVKYGCYLFEIYLPLLMDQFYLETEQI